MTEYRKNKFPVTIIRPTQTYGIENIPLSVKGDRGGWQVIHRIMEGKPVIIHGDESSLWTSTHNTDFAKGFVGLMSNSGAIGEAVHITSDEAITWDKMYDCIGDALGVTVKKVHVSTDLLVSCKPELEGGLLGDKTNTIVFDNSKLKRLVPDFVATMRFDQGVRLGIEHLLAHPELQIIDEEFDSFCDNIIEAQEKLINLFKK